MIIKEKERTTRIHPVGHLSELKRSVSEISSVTESLARTHRSFWVKYIELGKNYDIHKIKNTFGHSVIKSLRARHTSQELNVAKSQKEVEKKKEHE